MSQEKESLPNLANSKRKDPSSLTQMDFDEIFDEGPIINTPPEEEAKKGLSSEGEDSENSSLLF